MRVLVVEDHKELAATIAVGLRREGMAVDIAFDGEDALRHAAAPAAGPGSAEKSWRYWAPCPPPPAPRSPPVAYCPEVGTNTPPPTAASPRSRSAGCPASSAPRP